MAISLSLNYRKSSQRNSQMKVIIFLLTTLLSLLILTGCEDKGSNPENGAEKGYATGRVVDTQGQPIQGAEVVIDNTLIYNSTLVASTDANGTYKVKLPKVGTFATSARIKRQLNGKTYTLSLHPDDPEIFSVDGSVRNFEWKLTGAAGSEMQGYYGATISLNKHILSGIYDSENIEFTLVPKGKLIDGSTGKTLVRRPGKPHTADYDYLRDIPLGRYQLTAVYKGGGQSVPLKIGGQFDDANDHRTPFQLDFEPTTMWGDNLATISFIE
jgi:hypothetical protein